MQEDLKTLFKNRREKFLIYKPIQIQFFKIIFWSNILTLFVAVGAGFMFYGTVQNLAMLQDFSYLARTIDTLSAFIWLYFVYLICGFVVVTCLIFYAWLKMSNMIAGPLYNIKNTLEKYVRTGQFDKIVIRKNDRIHEIADLINESIEVSRKRGPHDQI